MTVIKNPWGRARRRGERLSFSSSPSFVARWWNRLPLTVGLLSISAIFLLAVFFFFSIKLISQGSLSHSPIFALLIIFIFIFTFIATFIHFVVCSLSTFSS